MWTRKKQQRRRTKKQRWTAKKKQKWTAKKKNKGGQQKNRGKQKNKGGQQNKTKADTKISTPVNGGCTTAYKGGARAGGFLAPSPKIFHSCPKTKEIKKKRKIPQGGQQNKTNADRKISTPVKRGWHNPC